MPAFRVCAGLLVASLAMRMPAVVGAAPVLPVINTANVFNVTDAAYGAIGDGVFTNTSPIQNAINSAAGAAGGGTVACRRGFICPGRWRFKSYVNLQLMPARSCVCCLTTNIPGGSSIRRTSSPAPACTISKSAGPAGLTARARRGGRVIRRTTGRRWSASAPAARC